MVVCREVARRTKQRTSRGWVSKILVVVFCVTSVAPSVVFYVENRQLHRNDIGNVDVDVFQGLTSLTTL